MTAGADRGAVSPCQEAVEDLCRPGVAESGDPIDVEVLGHANDDSRGKDP